jgi:hypothetical protein
VPRFGDPRVTALAGALAAALAAAAGITGSRLRALMACLLHAPPPARQPAVSGASAWPGLIGAAVSRPC